MNESSRIPNRRERRMGMKYQGLLKQKSKLSLSDWTKSCAEIRTKGNEIHQANVDRNENSNFAKLEESESKQVSTWKDEGYNDEEIEQLREAYALMAIKNKATWHTDKKVARKIIKDTRSQLQKRL